MVSGNGPALDPDYRRARTDLQKSERSAAILLAARQEFDERHFHGFTMRSVAQRVHISKAALYGYHASKHAILATLTAGMLSSWSHALREALEASRTADPTAAAGEVLSSIHGRETLLGLLDVLDPSVRPGLTEPEEASLDASMRASFAGVGAALEAAMPGMPAGRGAEVARAVLALARSARDPGFAVSALLRGASAG